MPHPGSDLVSEGAATAARRRVSDIQIVAAIMALVTFDRVAGDTLGLVLATGFSAAILMRRRYLLPIGLCAIFLTDLTARIAAVATLPAMAQAALTTALVALTYGALRRALPDPYPARSARALSQALIIATFGVPAVAATVALSLLDVPIGVFLDLAQIANWRGHVLGSAAIIPIVLVAGREPDGGGVRARDILSFLLAGAATVTVSALADHWFPYPFIVAVIPLLLAATRLPPVAVAVLGGICMVTMALNMQAAASIRTGVTADARVLAAMLTGVLPTGLALLLAELRTERRRLLETGDRLRQVLAGIEGHGFCSLDRKGIIVAWTDEIAAMKRCPADEALGLSFTTFFSAEDRAAGVPEALLDRATETGRAETVGWRVRPDGTRFWARISLEATHNRRGGVVGFMESIQDLTELQRSQSALLAAERRWGFALGSAGQGVWELDLAERQMHYSPIYTAMLGLPVDSFGADPDAWKALVHPEDVVNIPPDDSESQEETELRLRHASGHWIWISDRRRVAERDASGRPSRVIGAHTNITARKLAEEKFRLAVDASPNGLLIADAQGRITLANSEAERMFGWDPGTLLGRSIDELVPEAARAWHDALRVHDASRPARRMGTGRTFDGHRRDGTHFPIEVGLNPIRATEGVQVLCAITDVSARRLAEEKFRLAVEASPNGVLIVDRHGRITLINSEIERMFGWNRGALLGRSVDLLIPDDIRADHASYRTEFSDRPAARRMGAGRDLYGQRNDGSRFPVEIGLNPIVTAEGSGILCVVTDITARKQAEAELAVSEARYRTMADNFVDLVVQLDLDLRRTWVSPASMDILGLPPEALLGSDPSRIAHPDDLDLIERTLRRVADGADRDSFTARYRHADGRWLWMYVSLRLVRNGDGTPMGILAVSRDITRAREAEEALKASEATFRGAMAGAAIGMALEELDGRWLSVNPALCRILGAEEADLLGSGADRVTHPDDVDSDAESRRRLLAGAIASYHTEKRWLHSSGRIIWTQQTVSVDKGPDGRPRRLILQIQDITERRQIDLMKSEFISMVSHELRTPLTSIRGALGLVLGAMSREMPPRAIQMVDIALKNSERLIPLVNDILDLDKIDSGMLRIDLVDTDAVPLVFQAVEATRAFADRFGVRFAVTSPEIPVIVRADEGRFNQVITNLLSNAAKFSPRDGIVEVDMSVTGDRLRVAVRDHGPGIPDEFRPRIFGRFAQADSATTRAKGGSGLGLHICRQLVGLMGGDIDFESAVGAGSTFWVTFPLVAPVEAPRPVAVETRFRTMTRLLLWSRDTALTDYLQTVIASAYRVLVTSEPPGAGVEVDYTDVSAVLVDGNLAASPEGDDILTAMIPSDGVRPPVVLIGQAPPALVKRWGAEAVWPVDPQHPGDILRRLRDLVTPGRRPRVLHVEDDTDVAAVTAAGLAEHADVVSIGSAAAAITRLESEGFDLAILDPDLPDGNALALVAPQLDRLGIPFLVLSATETTAGDPPATLAHIVKSRVSEPQLVDRIVALLAAHRRPKRETRHVG